MAAPRSAPRSRPQPAAEEGPGVVRRGWEAVRGLVVVPSPGRLATLGGLTALTVGLLVVLVERTKGGFDRTGLGHLANQTSTAAAAPPSRASYIKR